MNPMFKHALAVVFALSCAACLRINVHGDPAAAGRLPEVIASAMAALLPLRVATYNASLYSDEAGGLLRRLQRNDGHARKIAAVLQRVRPDLVLLNEFDYDAGQRAADLFQRDYLEAPQPGGGDPLHYPYRFLAPVNTGVPSGLDLDGNGSNGDSGRERGNDAWGYGLHPGQYGMLVLSRYPIDLDTVRTFQALRWSAMPDASRPVDPASREFHYPDATWRQLRLSSKSHWDVPVHTPQGLLHFLVSHPTPPVFDGPEDRNGARNADEIHLWRQYISADAHSPEAQSWLCDDAGRCGGLDVDARFVIAGDLNNDPVDGDGRHAAIMELLEHPRVLRYPTPRGDGGIAVAADYAQAGIVHRGSPAHATGDFGPKVGTLRLDYVLPSVGFSVQDSGVFWPVQGDRDAGIADASDHHLVWIDLISAGTR